MQRQQLARAGASLEEAERAGGTGSASAPARVFATGTREVDRGILGTLDPTLLDNGTYDLIVTAWDLNAAGARINRSQLTRQIRIDGNLKPGAFTIQQSDLEIPGMGIPITISRTYSTLRADRDLDFGYGWQLDIGNPKEEVQYAEGPTLGSGRYRPLLENSRVQVTMNDGTTQGFTFRPLVGEFNLLGLATYYVPYFEPAAGASGWLEGSGHGQDAKLLRINVDNGNHEYIDMYTGQSYNPTRDYFGGAFQLTTREGLQYGIDANGEDFSWVEDRNGNKVTFTDYAITHSSGRSVTFERSCGTGSASGCHITKITDPAGNSINYEYQDGNLVAVVDREQMLLPEAQRKKTQFPYGDGTSAPSHFITAITDALGRPTTSNVYDVIGRVQKLTDAAGIETTTDYAAGTRVQTIRLPDGGESKLFYDRRGNVIREEQKTSASAGGGSGAGGGSPDPPPVITLRQFDPKDNMTRETRVVGQVDTASNGQQNDLTSTYTYDVYRAPLSAKDPRGNLSALSYDRHGHVKTATDPLGNTTRYTYDSRGNLIEAKDPSQVVTTFQYDAHGNLETAFNDAGRQLLLNQYSTHGDVISSTNATGQATSFQYDLLGQQIESSQVRQAFQPDGTTISVTIYDRTTYDANGRVTGTSQWQKLPTDAEPVKLWETSTLYNAAGQVIRSVDRVGLATETVYDKRGLQIETRTETRSVSEGTSAWLVTRTVYDSNGRAVVTTDSYVEGSTAPISGTRNTYDLAGRVIKTERLTNLVVTITGTDDLTRSSSYNTSDVTLVSTTETTYDNAGRVLSSKDAYGIETKNRYNRYGELIERRRQTYLVGQASHLPDGVSEMWLVTRTVYDDNGRSVFATDQFLVHVDAQGNETVASTVLGTATTYDDFGRVTKTQRVTGAMVNINTQGNTEFASTGTVLSVTETRYNAKGQVWRTIAADGQVTEYEYDTLGRQVATIGHAVAADSVGLPANLQSAIQNPQSTKVRLRTETVYDDQGRVKEELTNVVQVENSQGQVQQIDRSAQIKTEFKYDQYGNRIETKVTGGSGASAISITTKAGYDSFGRQTSETDAMGNRKSFEYDAQGRLAAVVLPQIPDPACGSPADPCAAADFVNPPQRNPRYEYGYNAQGNQTLIRDALGRETRFTFDAQGHQLTRELPLGVESSTAGDFTESFEYDPQGRQRLHVSFEGVVTKFVYDTSTGRLIERPFFDNLAAYNNGSGAPSEVWSYKYDAFGREIEVTQTADASVRTVSRTYDAEGRETRVASPEGVLNYAYDSLGRKTRAFVTVANADGSANVVHDFRYEYDALRRLAKVTVAEREDALLSTPETTSYRYDLPGNLDFQTTPDKVVTDYVYDALFRLDQLNEYLPDASTPDNFLDNPKLASYDYDVRADGKRTGVTETTWFADAESQAATAHTSRIDWTYDNVGRLVDEVFNHYDDTLDYRHHYDFDLVGNRLRKTVDQGNSGSVDDVITYLYDSNDRLLTESLDTGNNGSVDQTTTYGWTATQQSSKTVTDNALNSQLSTINYRYDLQGRMADVVTDTYSGGVWTRRERVQYDYDATGIRVSAVHEINANPTEDSTYETRTKTEYLIDHQNATGYQQVLQETVTNADTGELQKKLIFTVGLDVISQTTFVPGGPSAGETLVLHYDGHGSTRILTDLAAAIATLSGQRQLFTYDAYGKALGFNPLYAGTVMLYSGEQFDARIQQQYLRARWYDPATGRFNRLDPFAGNPNDPQSLHKYLYAHGDPIMLRDPTGMFGGLVGMVGAIGIAMQGFITELVTGAAIVTAIDTGGRAGFGAREAGLLLIAEGDFKTGFMLYNLGNRLIKLTFDVIEHVDTAFGLASIGAGLTLAAFKLYRAAPDLAQAALNFSRSTFLRARQAAIESGEFLSSRVMRSWDDMERFVFQGVANLSAWSQFRANLRTVWPQWKLVRGGRQFRVATTNINQMRQLIADLTLATKREVALLLMNDGTAIIRLGPSGQSVAVTGGVTNIIAHSHPDGHLVFSGDDINALVKRSQTETFLVGPAGDLVKWTSESGEWLDDIIGQVLWRS